MPSSNPTTHPPMAFVQTLSSPISKTILLPNAPPTAIHKSMPRMGLGTWRADINQTKNAVITAVKDGGYRFIDTANDYGNEHEVGEGLEYLIKEKCILKREELFIQCKLWNGNMRKENVRKDLLASLNDLKIDYVDNYVIHWPQACPAIPNGEGGPLLAWNTKGLSDPDSLIPAKHDNNRHRPTSEHTMFPVDPQTGFYSSDNTCDFIETWHAMEELVDEGLCKSLGISNFSPAQVTHLLRNGCKKYFPVVLQNECHLYLQEKDMQDFCASKGIVFQCYSPLGSAPDNPAMCPVTKPDFRIIEHPKVLGIAKQHGKTPAQIALRYLIQSGKSLAAKSITPERIISNIQIYDFELSGVEMTELASLNCGCRNLLWPGCAVHPNYPFKDCYAGQLIVPKPELDA